MQQITGITNIATTEPGNGMQTSTAPFADLSAGDTVSVEVIGVSGKEATFRTPEGREIHAQFPKGLFIKPGDFVELTMVSKDSGTAYLRLSAVNGQTVDLEANELQVFLMDMGLPPSRTNAAATQLLLRFHIEPTPEKIADLFWVAESLPEIPTSIAVFMAANKIPPTPENAEILMKWCSGVANFGKDIEEIGQLIQQSGKDLFTEVFRDRVMAQATPKQAMELQNMGFERLAVQLNLFDSGDAEIQASVQAFLEKLPLSPGERQQFETILTEGLRFAREAAGRPEAQAPVNGSREQTPVDAGLKQVHADIPKSDMAAIPKSGQTMQDGKMDVQPLTEAVNGREAGNLLETLSRLFVRIKGGDIQNDAKVLQDTVHGQQGLTESLKSGVIKLMGETSPAAQKANDLNTQARLGNQMEQFCYCQIPYETREGKGTADLYVFERSHAQKPGEKTAVTVLIGLDTQHMGRVEAVLRSEPPDNLSVEFRIMDEPVRQFFLENSEEFAAQMKSDGFPLSRVSVTGLKERATPLNVLKTLENEKKISISGIDIQV